jgi:hypothetical protein
MEKEPCCVDKVRQELMTDDDTIYAIRFGLANVKTFNNYNKRGISKTGQYLTIFFKDKKDRNGNSKPVRPKKTFISHDYCPFCGKKYE